MMVAELSDFEAVRVQALHRFWRRTILRHGMKNIEATICYLCGKALMPPTNADHPVMKQIFAPTIRRKHNISKLITFDVHKSCNTAYHKDEDYFVRSLMPFAR